jgi:Uma2 family endonuclease
MSEERLTTGEYLQTSETMLPQELVWGVVREASAPTPSHQTVVGTIFRLLYEHVAERQEGRVWLSPIDVVLDRLNALVVQPDVIVVLNERLHAVTDRVWTAPNLVIEVMSPQPRIGTVDERLDWFARYGVEECWLVHHLFVEVDVITFAGGAIASRRRFERGERLTSSVLPRLDVSVDEMM